jgi:hypothetical protein
MNLDEGFDVVSVGSGLGGLSFRSMAGGPQKGEQGGWSTRLIVAELSQTLRK